MARYDSSFGGVFAKYVSEIWDNTYEATLRFYDIAGGVPSDPKIAEGWIRSKVKETSKDERIRQAVEELMLLRNIGEEEAVEELNKKRNVNGFLRTPLIKDDEGKVVGGGQLFVEGRQIKAALKEAVSVALASGKLKSGNTTKAGKESDTKWGLTGKGAISFMAEHLQVLNGEVLLYDMDWNPVTGPTRIKQSFPVNPMTKQTGIQYTEICEDVQLKVMITSDWDITEKQWAAIWVTGNLQGIGASRSQDHGRYDVIGWKREEKQG
jgi:hypothetical protein